MAERGLPSMSPRGDAPQRSSGPAPAGDLDGLFRALESRIAERDHTWRGRLRERLARWPLAWRRAALAALALGLPLVNLRAPRPDAHAALVPQLAVLVALCALLGVTLLGRSLRGWHEPSGQPATRLAWVLGSALALTAWLALPASHHLAPHTQIPPGASTLQHVLPCLSAGLAFALPVYLWGRLLGSGSPGSHLFAAAGAALSGNLAILLHCAITDPAHLVPAHAGVMALALGLAWWRRA